MSCLLDDCHCRVVYGIESDRCPYRQGTSQTSLHPATVSDLLKAANECATNAHVLRLANSVLNGCKGGLFGEECVAASFTARRHAQQEFKRIIEELDRRHAVIISQIEDLKDDG